MKQEQRMDYLIDELLREAGRYRPIAAERKDKRNLLRSLMNVRLPGPIKQQFITVQDEFLKKEAEDKGIVAVENIPTVGEAYGSRHLSADRISVWQGDITRLQADAIVNAGNSRLLGCFVPCHGCIDNAIHSAAGVQLREECAELMKQQGHEERTGGAKITKAYNLPCRYVIHTVGPIAGHALREQDCSLLKSCYESCLALAEERGLQTIAFCCISTGEFHFPNDLAARIAVDTVEEWLKHSSLNRVIFNVFKDWDLELYINILSGSR